MLEIDKFSVSKHWSLQTVKIYKKIAQLVPQ